MLKLLIIFLFSLNSFAQCDWKTIKRTSQGFLYSSECHIEVGKLVKSEKLLKQQISSLHGQIKLGDLKYSKQVEITNKWRATSFSLEDRVIKSYKLTSFGNKINFLYGMATVVLGALIVGQIKTR